MIADTHVHSRLSDDAPQDPENTIDSALQQAKKQNLRYLCTCEHCDLLTAPGCYNVDFDAYEAAFAKAETAQRKEVQSPTRLLFGIELAHAHTQKKQAQSVLKAHAFDFVLGSLHLSRRGIDYWAVDYPSLPEDSTLLAMFEDYVGELWEIASSCDFDSLAHATYPLRYFAKAGRMRQLCEEPSQYVPLYADVFRQLIQRGKALEVNTSTLEASGFPMPQVDLIRLYYDMGGRLVTTGSDSHDYRTVAHGIDRAEQLLRDIGFAGVTVFVGRKPHIIPFSA